MISKKRGKRENIHSFYQCINYIWQPHADNSDLIDSGKTGGSIRLWWLLHLLVFVKNSLAGTGFTIDVSERRDRETMCVRCCKLSWSLSLLWNETSDIWFKWHLFWHNYCWKQLKHSYDLLVRLVKSCRSSFRWNLSKIWINLWIYFSICPVSQWPSVNPNWRLYCTHHQPQNSTAMHEGFSNTLRPGAAALANSRGKRMWSTE